MAAQERAAVVKASGRRKNVSLCSFLSNCYNITDNALFFKRIIFIFAHFSPRPPGRPWSLHGCYQRKQDVKCNSEGGCSFGRKKVKEAAAGGESSSTMTGV
ncbi:hypothetical protein OSB04_027633 [Centaurea solstitialis]|uniref:Uncharacterized protein n=1 Tax=Centaurea solstitialis TaxID=347529 RepID=A0AA38VZW1_9ASTR|nr:hypothetical protein OSB04_027633 [Centaurea solstitialis]